MMNNKPSAGALRAAKAICDKWFVGDCDEINNETAAPQDVALIIDRETGLDELLEAADKAKEGILLWSTRGGIPSAVSRAMEKIGRELEQAITKGQS